MIKNNADIWPKTLIESPKKHQLFQGLSEVSLQQILENSTLQNFKSSKLLIQQGDDPTYVYLIIEGSLRSFRANIDGDEATIKMLETGETCMEAVVFMGGPSPISVQAISDVRLMMIPANFVRNFVLQDHQFSANILKIVTHHYKDSLLQIEGMSIKSPLQRVGYYFLQKHIEQDANNMDFELPFKKSMIANQLGMTPETFSRALSQIKKSGIDIDGEKIHLKEAYALCHFCDIDAAHECTLENKTDCEHCPMHAETCH